MASLNSNFREKIKGKKKKKKQIKGKKENNSEI